MFDPEYYNNAFALLVC